MTNKGLSRSSLCLLDRLTDRFPRSVPPSFQKAFLLVLGNRLTFSYYYFRYSLKIRDSVGSKRILVLCDVGIGDAIIVQEAVHALTENFPTAGIDYVCNRLAAELLHPLPGVHRVFPFYAGGGAPSKEECERLRSEILRTPYSLIINFSPFFYRSFLRSGSPVVDAYVPFTAFMIRQWKKNAEGMHISVAIGSFLREFFGSQTMESRARFVLRDIPETRDRFRGNVIFLSDQAVASADRCLEEFRFREGSRLLFFNPDASSRYSLPPLDLQVGILRAALRSDAIGGVLLGVGHTQKGIELALLDGLPPSLKEKIRVVGKLPLPVFAALLDACDMFVSGDGGPTHIAAARKISVSGLRALRNRTAVVSIFGATDSRMYGYDSSRAGHVGANQDVPSRVFVADTPCRNITCVNKLGKTCATVRCFEGLDPGVIAEYITSYFESLASVDMNLESSQARP